MRGFIAQLAQRILAVSMTAGVLLIAVVFFLYGATTGLGTLFGAQPWVAWIVIGGVVLIGVTIFSVREFSQQKDSPDFSKIIERVVAIVLVPLLLEHLRARKESE